MKVVLKNYFITKLSMKKLAQIKGITKLTRKEQKTVNGGFIRSIYGCRQSGPRCCLNAPGEYFCEIGVCVFGECLYY